ncbi:molybdopterin oxidoreductase family protein [Telmatospirillum sp. J64-1]|uniref:molybdopterin oxidoreductase family protein n=1 Tax=Telmatospirillum sp. J64-1 TaxID=2502183 RepID=UPI00115DCF3B|nr:molybdopterin oxidoreductase family protein [Telmatospirillum sp. J64-1]
MSNRINASNRLRTACPHDCPSACAVEAEVLPDGKVGRLHGGAMPYTDGILCAKVARYAERVHNPGRIETPLLRDGPKGSGRFRPITWDEAMDRLVAEIRQATERHGAETVWPYFYGGTLGVVQQGSTKRLRHVMGWSGLKETICSTVAGTGWMAGAGVKRGLDPREMTESDLIVIWGANPVATQVHLMSLIQQAKRNRGAKLVVIDPYRTPTAEKADLHLCLKPGTDGALACAVMHVLFKEGFADRDYIERYTSGAAELEAHLASRDPAWASEITGLTEEEILAFAQIYGRTKRSFLRLGYGFSRSRNGAVSMHAAACLPAITGAWRHPGGGAVQSNSATADIDASFVQAKDYRKRKVRNLDMSRLGRVLANEPDDLAGGPPVTVMLVQNTNPALVAPESALVRQGLLREDLFLCVHEQVMTETALLADLVLPAPTFLEHDDLVQSYGHTLVQVAPKVIEPLGQARSNHDLINDLAQRLGAAHPAFGMTAWELVDDTLRRSGLPGADELYEKGWADRALPFETAHFLDGFGWPDGRFRFKPDWSAVGSDTEGMPALPDHWAVTEAADDEHPFRLVTAPSRHFLNSCFNDTPTSRSQAQRPTALLHPEDCAALGLAEGGLVRIGNRRGETALHLRPFEGLRRGTVVVEGIWGSNDFPGGAGINTLVGAEAVQPAGGAAFHDTAVWLKPA